MTPQNYNCDGSGPHVLGIVRVLPMGGHGNAILCQRCYYREIAFRRHRNRELARDAQFDLPKWETLNEYQT